MLLSLVEAVARAGIQGLATALPISDSGHLAALNAALGASPSESAPSAGATAASALVLVALLRHRLSRAALEARHAVRRPVLFRASEAGRDAATLVLGSVFAVAAEWLLRPAIAPLQKVPLAVGIGLLLTACTLGITALAPIARQVGPSLLGSAATAAAYGLAMAPGVSQIAAAFAVLCWLGVARQRAAELSLLITSAVLIFRLGRFALLEASWSDVLSAAAGVGLVAGALGTVGGVLLWRELCARGWTARLALWLVPLAVAMLAYGYAL